MPDPYAHRMAHTAFRDGRESGSRGGRRYEGQGQEVSSCSKEDQGTEQVAHWAGLHLHEDEVCTSSMRARDMDRENF